MSVVSYPTLSPTPTEVEYNHAIENIATGSARTDDIFMAEPFNNTSWNESTLRKRKESTRLKPSGFAGVTKEKFSSRKPNAVLRNMDSAISSDAAGSLTAGARHDRGKGIATNSGASAAESSTAAATKRGDHSEDTLFVDKENLYSSRSSDDEYHKTSRQQIKRHAMIRNGSLKQNGSMTTKLDTLLSKRGDTK
jgi:hypothetical protein